MSVAILAEAVDSPILSNPVQVNPGSIINSIYLRVEALHNSGTWVVIPRVYMAVIKDPANELANPFPADVGVSDVKRFVIHQEMMMVTGIAADDNSFPRTFFQGVIKIPRGYRRFGHNDRLKLIYSLDVAATTATVSVCSQCIYKEYR